MNHSNIIMYTTEDGLTKIETTFEDDTVWLSIVQMAELFQRNKSTISRHISKIYEEGELSPMGTVAKFATVQMEGTRSVERNIEYYNLDVIISVGYRVKSHRGTQFRIWAMGILKEYMQKGFALDDDRLKRLGGGNYFDELLARIRDIRSSEKVFWRKVLEIYATSIDYDPRAESSILFFKQLRIPARNNLPPYTFLLTAVICSFIIAGNNIAGRKTLVHLPTGKFPVIY